MTSRPNPSRFSRRCLAAALALLAAASVACTSRHSDTRPLHAAETYQRDGNNPGASSRDPRALPMFAAASATDAPGQPIDWQTLLERARAADAILIGETHGHALGGAVASALFDDLLDTEPQLPIALSMEFFERDHQAHLDDYLVGVTDEETFKKRTGRAGPSEFGPGNYPAGHRAMINAAKESDRPVIGANASRRYVTIARKESLERLRGFTPEQRRHFEVPDSLTEGDYRDRFLDEIAQSMAAHMPEVEAVDPGEGDPAMADAQQRNLDNAAYEMAKGYYRAQNVWDATMADSVARALDQGYAPVVHVVGQFHVQDDGGLTQRLRSLRPGATILTIALAVDTPGQVTQEDSPALRDEDVNRADIVIYVGDPADW